MQGSLVREYLRRGLDLTSWQAALDLVRGWEASGDWHTNVPCRRSPGRRRCLGDIMADLDRTSGHISWQCPVCGDHGLIHGWEGTLWNRHGGGCTVPSDTPPTTSP